ncbi:MAG: endolytic transglycosylase MltG, partial [Muribaculaceae bacterium]|nr:endolytic transglycosylase MltG [Muribaculaceae bacterium]
EERPIIARLYINRLDRNMPLPADPTVKFAGGDFGRRRITGKHLQVNSPYNTYKVNGLPPGPIRVVDRKTLEQVLTAPRNEYLYMCAREDFSGYHNFARDLAEHNANAARYRAELNRRGIK